MAPWLKAPIVLAEVWFPAATRMLTTTCSSRHKHGAHTSRQNTPNVLLAFNPSTLESSGPVWGIQLDTVSNREVEIHCCKAGKVLAL